MRIVFDAYWWVSGPPSLRHVVRETLIGWQRLFPADEIIMVVSRSDVDATRSEVPATVTVVGTRWWPQALLATVACPRTARRLGADVVFTQNFAATAPVSVVFIHDVLFETNPEWFSRLELPYFALMPRLARRARTVMTSSATEARRIAEHSRARRVVPVGIGMSTELIDGHGVDPVPGLRPGCFVLTVGRLNVRKNLGNTIAGALASGQISADLPLVVAGAANGKGERLPEWIAEAVADGRVVFTGHVPESQLRWLYANTALFLFLSLGEGFGMPTREALHFGAPMIVSDIEVLREILPAGITRVAPGDVPAIAAAIRETLDTIDSSATPTGSPAGAEPARDYNWDDTVSAMRAELVACLRDSQVGHVHR